MHHIDPQEAQEVVRLAAARQVAPSDGPTVGGLAEALGLSESEVERLLAEVRSRKIMSEVAPQRRFGDRSAALSAAIVLALVLVVAVVGGAAFLMFGVRSPASETMTVTTPVTPVPSPDESPTAPAAPAPSGVSTAGGGESVTIQTAPDGGTTITDAEGVKTKIRTTDDGAVRMERSKPPTRGK